MKRLLLLFILLTSSSTVMATEPLKVTYGLFTGGFNVATVNAIYNITDTHYKIDANLNTAGVLGTLAPWTGVINTSGNTTPSAYLPQTHNFASTWRGDTKTNQFKFDNEGQLVSFNKIENNGTAVDEMPLIDVYQDGAIDILTALLNSMNGSSCATKQDVTDGKRRFNLIFKSKGSEVLKANDYNRFSGKSEICEIEVIPTAGKWREKPRGWMNIQGQAKAKGQLPLMWFGKVNTELPAIPVRMQIKTDYGTMLLHLQSID